MRSFLGWVGTLIVELVRITRLALYALIIVAVVWLVSVFTGIGGPVVGTVRSLTDALHITRPAKIEKPLPERVPEQDLKCRAYTMLADLAGAKVKREDDQRRLIQLVRNRAKADGTSECTVFAEQSELVPQGWGRRLTNIWNPLKGRYTYVPLRREAYVENTFSKVDVDHAMLLAQEMAAKPDPSWDAIVVVRPARENTFGNQKPEELAAIAKAVEERKLELISLPRGAASDFIWYRAGPMAPKR